MSADKPIALLRFLGARGRAERGTTDPLNRLQAVWGDVWIHNPPGYGASAGGVSLQLYADSALAVFDEMVRCWPNANPWVYGQSLGTVAALHVSANRRIKALILKNVTPLADLMRFHMPALPDIAIKSISRGIPGRLDVLENAARSFAPCLFQISRNDRLAPVAIQEKVRSVYGGPASVCEILGPHDIHQYSEKDELSYSVAIQALYDTSCRHAN